MKRIFSWTAADDRNEELNGSLASVTHAEVSVQRPVPSNGHRIPIVFLTPATEEEQCVPIRRHQVSAQTDQQKEIAIGRPISARMLLKITEEEII